MEKKKNVKKIRLEEAGKSWLLLGLAFSFMLCIFAPLETFLTNQAEFWFSLSQVLPTIFIAFLCINILCFLLYLVIRKSKIFIYVYAFLFCAFVFFYIQGNYVPRNYGVLDGKDIVWSSYTAYAVVSIVLLSIALIAYAVICFKVKEKIYGAGQFICIILMLIQVVTIGTVFIQHNVLDKSEDNNLVVTSKDAFNLSEEGNIIVFILDTFDSYVMEDLLAGEYGNEYSELFENFVYYPDTVGAYPTTKCALPHILTGQWYENDIPYGEYIKKAYGEIDTYDILKNNGYSIGVYTSSIYLNPEYDIYTNVEHGDYEVSNYLTFTEKLYKLVAFNYMPHQLKKYFYTTSADFDIVKTSSAEDSVYTDDVQKFNMDLLGNGLSVNSEQKSFRIYHLAGIHNPFTFGENLESVDGEKYDVYDEAKGNFTLLESYFKMMQEEGIYDNSTIIIMADHGSTGFSQNPLFMIKNASENHEFQISSASMSYSYLHDIFCRLAEGEFVNDGYIQELAESSGTRRFLFYSWDNSWQQNYLPTMTEYNVTGEATEHGNCIATGRTFLAGDASKSYEYKLGTELSFGEERTGNEYCLSGFYNGEQSFTRTAGNTSELKFKVEEDFEALAITMGYTVYKDYQRVRVFVDDTFVEEFYAKKDEERTILIPGNAVKNHEFKIRFELPDAESPKARGDGDDTRVLGLALKTFVMSGLSQDTYNEMLIAAQNKYLYEFDTELSFGEENTAGEYCLYGFYGNENEYTWAGATSEMEFKIEDEYDALVLTMDYIVGNDQQRVLVYIDDSLVEEYITRKDEERTILIPKEVIKGQTFRMRLECPDAKSPKELGKGNDTRVLGLALKSFNMSGISQDKYNEMLVAAQNKYLYEFDTKISFGEEDTAERYCVYGFYNSEKERTWAGSTAEMQFKIEEEFEALALTMKYVVSNEQQRVLVYIDDILIEEYVARNNEEKTLLIPKETIKGQEFILRIECPDAKSPKELGNGNDSRILGLAMESLTMSGLDKNKYDELVEAAERRYMYELGTELLFAKGEEAANRYCLYGFDGNEKEYTWIGSTAEMQFRVEEEFEALAITMGYTVHKDYQRVRVYVDDVFVGEFCAKKDEKNTMLIPGDVVKNQEFKLRFELPDAESPKELGTGYDARVLGLALKTFTISGISQDSYNEMLEAAQNEYEYKFDTKLAFGEEYTAGKHCVYGFYDHEKEHCWIGSAAGMQFYVDEFEVLEISIEYEVYTDARDVLVYVNDVLVEQYVAEISEKKKILVPKEVINGQEIRLRIECPNAESPKELGTGYDARVLGLAMKSITISAVNE